MTVTKTVDMFIGENRGHMIIIRQYGVAEFGGYEYEYGRGITG